MKDNRAVNRAKLVDEPIVEMILSRRYLKSGVNFEVICLECSEENFLHRCMCTFGKQK